MNHILEVEDLSKIIDGQRVLDRVSLAISAGSIYGIVGANGAGKTTLLKMLNGVYQPTSGVVRVFGERLPNDAAGIRQRVHYVSADGAFYPGFRVSDLLRYASLLYARWDQARCDALVEALELPVHRSIRKLSLGMKMQLRLAVALASHPDVLLLDEPTNGLDPVVRRQFLQLIVQEVAGSRMSVVMATHRLDDLEAIADGVSVLYGGRVVLSGDLETFKHDFREVIAVTEIGEIPDIEGAADLISMRSRGTIHTFIVRGNTDALERRLKQHGASHVEIQPIAFEEAFRALMEKAGYSRDAILLS